MSDTSWLTGTEQRIWRTYLLGAAELLERLDSGLRPYGLTLNEYSILVCLSESTDRRLRMSELADAVHQSRSRLTHTITRMEQSGRVRRTTCGADRRGVWAELTDTGAELLNQAAPAHVASVRRHFVDAGAAEDFAALGRVFDAVLDVPRDDGTLAPRQLLRVAPSPTAEADEDDPDADQADPADTFEAAEDSDPRLSAATRS
ncbi:MAG TPA: MarR family transcriptional regulator [Microlunatus sp.]